MRCNALGCVILLESISVICLCVDFAPRDYCSYYCSLMPLPRHRQEVEDEYSKFTCESYVIDTQEKRTLALDAHNKVKRVWHHLNRKKAEQELRDDVDAIVKKLRHKLDLSVPSLGKYIVSVRLRKDKDKEQVLIQKKTSAKPVLHVVSDNVGCHLMRRVRAKCKVKYEPWKCMRCRVSTCNAKMCGKLRLRECEEAVVRVPHVSTEFKVMRNKVDQFGTMSIDSELAIMNVCSVLDLSRVDSEFALMQVYRQFAIMNV